MGGVGWVVRVGRVWVVGGMCRGTDGKKQDASVWVELRLQGGTKCPVNTMTYHIYIDKNWGGQGVGGGGTDGQKQDASVLVELRLHGETKFPANTVTLPHTDICWLHACLNVDHEPLLLLLADLTRVQKVGLERQPLPNIIRKKQPGGHTEEQAAHGTARQRQRHPGFGHKIETCGSSIAHSIVQKHEFRRNFPPLSRIIYFFIFRRILHARS